MSARSIGTCSLRAVPRKKGTNPLIKASYEEAKENGFNINRLLTGGNPFKDEE